MLCLKNTQLCEIVFIVPKVIINSINKLCILLFHIESGIFKYTKHEDTFCQICHAQKLKMRFVLIVNVIYMNTLEKACSETLQKCVMILYCTIIRKTLYTKHGMNKMY